MDIKQYEQSKFTLAEILRSAQAVSPANSSLHNDCQNLQARLAEDLFQLVVVGRFSRGKSTLMNAMLGANYLPTGIVPLTSVITTVGYGSRPISVLHYQNSRLNREIPLSQLPEYITQSGNPGNSKQIAWAEIQLPVELLRRGFHFVDTPGLGSPILENTLTTERFLPQADAFLLVTSYDSALSVDEDRILRRIQETNKKLFVLLNKSDTANSSDRRLLEDSVASRLTDLFPGVSIPVHSISARQALEARLSGDETALRASGIPSFESALLQFLIHDRARSFLTNMYARVLDLLLAWNSSPQMQDHHDAWSPIVDRLRSRQESITGAAQPLPPAILPSGAHSQMAGLQLHRKTACNICVFVHEAIFHFLSKYQYDLATVPEVQHAHARRGGFCPLHTWQYESIASPHGISVAYPSLVRYIAEDLRAAAEDPGAFTGNNDGSPLHQRSCPACEVHRKAESEAISHTVSAIHQAMESNGLMLACCMPHLVMVARTLGANHATQRLLRAHAELLERVAEDMQRYALKHEALRRHLASDEERSAAYLGLLLLAGYRSLSAPPLPDRML